MAIFEGITATKAAFDVSKQISDLFNHPDVKPDVVRGRLIELQQHILNAQAALGEAREEMASLKEQLTNKETLKALAEDMQYRIDGGFYVRASEIEKGVIPYCPLCWNKDGLTIPLDRLSPGHFRCSLHHVAYETDEHRNRPQHTNSYRRGRPPTRGWMS